MRRCVRMYVCPSFKRRKNDVIKVSQQQTMHLQASHQPDQKDIELNINNTSIPLVYTPIIRHSSNHPKTLVYIICLLIIVMPPNGRPRIMTTENNVSYDAINDQEKNAHHQRDHLGGSPDSDTPSNEYVLNVAFLSFVLFMALQGFFALVANSQSMLADSEAMSVDALTYLFNLLAERIKNRPPTEKELLLPLIVREHNKEMKRLYLELIPPLISVTTLIAVTIVTLKEAFHTLYGEGAEEEDVSANLMLFFSGLNLLLDVVNVTCFARAHQAYGLQKTYDSSSLSQEESNLLERNPRRDEEEEGERRPITCLPSDHETHDSFFEAWFGNVNLNMCSAWTVSHLIPCKIL